MIYMGSKRRIAKHILPIMLKEIQEKGYNNWVEPFVGGGNVIDKVPSNYERTGYDLNGHVIQAMIDIRDNPEELPESFSFDDRKYWRGQEPSKLNSWACIVTSFGADLTGGYARCKGSDDSTYCMRGKRNAMKQTSKIQSVNFILSDYKDILATDSLIYCDPPYQKTSGYKTGNFNHEEFFDWCRKMKAQGNSVFVSEYSAPEDFEEVWQGIVKTNFSSTRKEATHQAVEKLFKV